MLTTLVTLIFVFALLAVLWWAVTKMGLPQPFQIIAVAVIAVVAIVALFELLEGVGGHGLSLR